MADPHRIAVMGIAPRLAAVIVLAVGVAGCTSANQAARAQEETARAKLATAHAEAATAEAAKATEAAAAASLQAQKAVEDANREIAADEQRMEQLRQNASKPRRRPNRRITKTSSEAN